YRPHPAGDNPIDEHDPLVGDDVARDPPASRPPGQEPGPRQHDPAADLAEVPVRLVGSQQAEPDPRRDGGQPDADGPLEHDAVPAEDEDDPLSASQVLLDVSQP